MFSTQSITPRQTKTQRDIGPLQKDMFLRQDFLNSMSWATSNGRMMLLVNPNNPGTRAPQRRMSNLNKMSIRLPFLASQLAGMSLKDGVMLARFLVELRADMEKRVEAPVSRRVCLEVRIIKGVDFDTRL